MAAAVTKLTRSEAHAARPATLKSVRRRPRALALVPKLARTLIDFPRSSKKVSLLGIGIDCVTEKQVIARVLSSLREKRGGWIVTPNVDHLRILSRRPDLREMVAGANIVIADGMPLIWASKLQGTPLPQRVPGSGLMLSLTAAVAKTGASIYLLGGNLGEAETSARVLENSMPGLKVAGTMCPPMGFDTDPVQMRQIALALKAANPDIVYVCLGFPKQELVITALREVLPSAWFLGVGGSLGMVSGKTRRAPKFMQSAGLEWVWRLGLEPRRLFDRYILNDLPFAIRLLAAALIQRCAV